MSTLRLFPNPAVAAEADPGQKAIYRRRNLRREMWWRSPIAFGDPDDLPGPREDWIEISRRELDELATEAVEKGGGA